MMVTFDLMNQENKMFWIVMCLLLIVVGIVGCVKFILWGIDDRELGLGIFCGVLILMGCCIPIFPVGFEYAKLKQIESNLREQHYDVVSVSSDQAEVRVNKIRYRCDISYANQQYYIAEQNDCIRVGKLPKKSLVPSDWKES